MFKRDWAKTLYDKIQNNKIKIGIVGLGYVGLPLALVFAKKYEVYGFDVDRTKISMLKNEQSYIVDVSSEELARVLNKSFYPSSEERVLDETYLPQELEKRLEAQPLKTSLLYMHGFKSIPSKKLNDFLNYKGFFRRVALEKIWDILRSSYLEYHSKKNPSISLSEESMTKDLKEIAEKHI